MSYSPLALAAAVAALFSMHVTSAEAQSAYVAPGGGMYMSPGAGPVYVTPGAPATAYVRGRGRSAYAVNLNLLGFSRGVVK